jgi:hypothetical protein
MKLSAAVWYEMYLRVLAHREGMIDHVTKNAIDAAHREAMIGTLTLTAHIFLQHAILAASQEALAAEVKGYKVLRHAVDDQTVALPEPIFSPFAYAPIDRALKAIDRARTLESTIRAHNVPDGELLLAQVQADVEKE